MNDIDYTFLYDGKQWEYNSRVQKFFHYRRDGKREIIFQKHPWWINLYNRMMEIRNHYER